MKWFLCLPALSEFCWLLNEIPKFRKKWKKKFFLFPWQGADGSEDAFMGTRVTRDRVSDNLESMIIFSFPGLWCYIGSSTIVTGFKTGFLIINSSLFRGVQGVVWLIIVEVERKKIRRVISINRVLIFWEAQDPRRRRGVGDSHTNARGMFTRKVSRTPT